MVNTPDNIRFEVILQKCYNSSFLLSTFQTNNEHSSDEQGYCFIAINVRDPWLCFIYTLKYVFNLKNGEGASLTLTKEMIKLVRTLYNHF